MLMRVAVMPFVVTAAIAVGIAPLIPAPASASTSAISSPPSGRRFRQRPAAMTIIVIMRARGRSISSSRRPTTIMAVIVVAPTSRRAAPATPPASAFTPAPMLPCRVSRSAAAVLGIAAVAAAILSVKIAIGTIIRTSTMMSTVAVIGTSPSSSAPFAAIARASPIVVAVHVYIIVYNMDQPQNERHNPTGLLRAQLLLLLIFTTIRSMPFSLLPLPASSGPLSVGRAVVSCARTFSGTTYAVSRKSKNEKIAWYDVGRYNQIIE